jgi:uncharacterized membrane protein YccC
MGPIPLPREVLRLDRSRLAFAVAIPGAIGFALPLVIGLAAGQVSDGVIASTGALIVGFADLGGAYRLRALTLLATSAAVMVAGLLGGLVATDPVLTVAAIGIWGFAGGLMVVLDRRTAFVGMLSTWALLLTSDLGLHGAGTLRTTLLIGAGALLQTALALVVWPLRPLAPERRTVADAYRALADYAADPSPTALAAGATALSSAAETLATGSAGSGSRGALRALVEQGEWIRLELTALARGDRPPTADPVPVTDAGAAPRRDVAAVLEAAAVALGAIAVSISRPQRTADVQAALAGLRCRADAIGPGAARRAAIVLVGRIAAAAARRGEEPEIAAARESDAALAVLRAQLTPSSSAFRHAARLAVALMVAVVAYRSLSLGRGYWVPLTVLFVLKPDHGTTFARGIGRAGGTMLGVAIAWALVTTLSPSDGAAAVLLALLTFGAYAVYPANYALFSVLLTVVIALLAQFAGGSPIGALEDRLLDTALGGAIALAAFALWPTREAATSGQRLAVLVDRQRAWLELVLSGFQDDAAYDRSALRDRRLETRRARADAEAAVARAQAEPTRRRPDPRLPLAVLAAMERLAESTLVLVSSLHEGGRTPTPALSPFARACGDCLAVVSGSLRSGAWRAPWLPRDETTALADAAGGAAADDVLTAVVAPEARLILAALEGLEGGAPIRSDGR